MQQELIECLNRLSVGNSSIGNISRNDGENGAQIIPNPSVMNIDLAQYGLMSIGQDCVFVNEVLSYRDVNKNSREFKEIRKVFLQENLVVTSIKAVVNPFIKQSFELTRMFRYENLDPLLLYHGTKEKYVDSICTFNFNWRYSGYEKGFRFGKGVNFSDKPIYSSMFCDKKKSKRVIIITDVLIKVISKGNPNLVLPPPGADTAIGKGTRVFVKFNDNEFCPKYVVNFKQVK